MTVAVEGPPMVGAVVAGASLIIVLLSVGPIAPILAAGAPKLHELHSVARVGDLAAVKVRFLENRRAAACSGDFWRLADADRRWWDRQRARWRRVRCSVLARRRSACAHRTCKRLGGSLLQFFTVVVFSPARCPRVPSFRDWHCRNSPPVPLPARTICPYTPTT